MEKERDKKLDSRVGTTFCSILDILDQETFEMNFHGIDIYAGDEVYRQFHIKPDGFYDFDKRLVTFKDLVDPIEFQDLLKMYVSMEEGYTAEITKYAPNTKVLHINIV